MTESQGQPDLLFISYATEDAHLAEWLALKLALDGYGVWCDRFNLLGGESYPRDIDDAIKNRSFRMLALMSRHSLRKPNPLKERTLGYNLSRSRKVDFVIPLVVDDIRADELDWMSSDITFISFRDSWAQGLRGLLKRLDTLKAPRSLEHGSQLVSNHVAEHSKVLAESERIWSNLFEIHSMPQNVYRVVLPEGVCQPSSSAVAFRQSSRILWSLQQPRWDSEAPSGDITVHDWKLDRRSIQGITPAYAVERLLHELVRKRLLARGAKETPDQLHLHLSYEATHDGWLSFAAHDARRSRVRAIGQRTFRATDGSRSVCRYYLVPVFRPTLSKYGLACLELNIRLHLTDGTGIPLDSKSGLRRRKRIARGWWNHQWLSRVLAIGEWMSGGQPTYDLADSADYKIEVSGMPLTTTAPVGILDDSPANVPLSDKDGDMEDNEDADITEIGVEEDFDA